MKVKLGGTRIVLVFQNFVVKIPRINLFIRPAKRVIYHLARNQVKEKLKNYDQNLIKAGIKYVFAGMYANKIEYYYSRQHKENNEIVHVRGVLYYLILIQKRVETIKEDDKKWKAFIELSLKRGIKDTDLLVARNFGLYENKIKLIDYGREETITTLNQLCC